MITQAFILSAGLGTRMQPITHKTSKVLVSVAGRTLIDRALDSLVKIGIERVVVNVHHHADLVESHLKGRGDIEILISDEREKLLDSGGGIKKGLELLTTSDFVVLNADSFWQNSQTNNLKNLISTWRPDVMDMNLLLSPLESSVGYSDSGDFIRHDTGHLERIGTTSQTPYVYSGAMVTKPNLFTSIPSSIFSLNELFDTAISTQRLFGEILQGIWYHVGTPDSITVAEASLEEGGL